MRGFVIASVGLVCLAGIGRSQSPMPLTLADAQKLALQNNPQVAVSRYSADAAAQITKEVGSAVQPTVFGSVTGTGADSGSRLAAGVLSNPSLDNHAGSGCTVDQP